jgi:hypothetical protein
MHYTTLGASRLNVSRQSLQQFSTDSPWTPAAGWRSGCGFVVDVLSRWLADGLVEGGGTARDRVVMGCRWGGWTARTAPVRDPALVRADRSDAARGAVAPWPALFGNRDLDWLAFVARLRLTGMSIAVIARDSKIDFYAGARRASERA